MPTEICKLQEVTDCCGTYLQPHTERDVEGLHVKLVAHRGTAAAVDVLVGHV